MIRIGILGDIGSGKSFIAKSFGYPVFNADVEVGKLYKKAIRSAPGGCREPRNSSKKSPRRPREVPKTFHENNEFADETVFGGPRRG